MWNGGMMEWGGGGFFGLGHLLWWALLIAGLFVLVRYLVRTGSGGDDAGRGRALSILRERYARGEIDKAEFDARRRDIE